MRLISFSVENYRSITTARKIPLERYSLLIGANNEGKSNILHALALGMNALSGWMTTLVKMPDGRTVRMRSSGARPDFNWETDYPVDKQKSAKADACTKVTLEFSLNDNETEEFRREIKSSLNGTLPIMLSFGKSGINLSVQKPGRGHATLNKKSSKIASFVSDRLRFHYIPAIRTSASASEVIYRLVEKELKVIEGDPEYIGALEKIEQLQKPIFDELGGAIQKTVSGFLPTVKSVELVPARESRYRALRREIEILIDDGSLTKLSRKGDGVQSLAALALMRHAAMETSDDVSSIIAIEEPESHLHPRAIHELRSVIDAISEKSQVILTSHSPLFVKANNLQNTIIVQGSKARCAEKVSEIRDVLGVRFADNLQNARLVLIVEGRDDIISLSRVISARSSVCKKALDDGLMTIDDLGGAGSLAQKASFYQASACEVHAFLDNDEPGRNAVKRAIDAKSLRSADVNLSILVGRENSELEDLFNREVYRDAFLDEFGVDVTRRLTNRFIGKWSDVLGRNYAESGKLWDNAQKAQCKAWLANFAALNANRIIGPTLGDSVDALILSLERKLKSL